MAKPSKVVNSFSIYAKERKRVLQAIRRQIEKGYRIEMSIPTVAQLKKDTSLSESDIEAKIQELKQITPQQLRETALPTTEKFIDTEIYHEFGKTIREIATREVDVITGQIMSEKITRISNGEVEEIETIKEGEIISRTFDQRKTDRTSSTSFFSRQVISNFKAEFAPYNSWAKGRIYDAIDKAISVRGVDDVAVMINDSKSENYEYHYSYGYSEELLERYISGLLSYLPDIGNNEMQDIVESVFENGAGESYTI